jgi:large conductance mechanosensitive channel
MTKIKEKLNVMRLKTFEEIKKHKERARIIKEFKEFLKEYKIVGLTIGFIMGIVSTALVKSLVDNIIMPLTSPIVPTGSWQNATINIWKFSIKLGAFVGELINFLIIAFVIFLIVKFIIRTDKKEEKK